MLGKGENPEALWLCNATRDPIHPGLPPTRMAQGPLRELCLGLRFQFLNQPIESFI